MPTKCKSCRHYGTFTDGATRLLVPGLADRSRKVLVTFCSNDLLASDEIREMFPNRKGLPLDFAHNICDREGDGHFVYFEPRDPSAGAAFSSSPPYKGGVAAASADGVVLSSPSPLVQITRTKTMTAAA